MACRCARIESMTAFGVTRGVCGSSPYASRVPHLMSEPRRRHQRLRRHAAGPETIAAELLALDQRDLAPEPRAAGGGDESGGAAADDDDVEVFRA